MVSSPPGVHEEMLRRSRAAYENRGDQDIMLTEEDEAILDRAWAAINLTTATDAELLEYSRISRARDAGDEPPATTAEDEDAAGRGAGDDPRRD